MPRLEPTFLEAPSGRLFCLQVHPDGRSRGAICHLPAFGEEMNKARHMVLQAAWMMAEQGWRVCIVDPLGTGDSAEDFGAASWAAWVGDAAWCHTHLADEQEGLPWIWWGLRSGALLASAASERVGGDGMLLWQPVLSGKQFLTQFLRLKLASESLTGAEGGTDTKQLRAALEAGDSVEVGGYMLAPALASGLDAAGFTVPAGMPLAWLEISAREEPDLLPASRQRAEALRAAGHTLHTRAVHGAAFWQSLEICEVPTLLQASLAALETLLDKVPA